MEKQATPMLDSAHGKQGVGIAVVRRADHTDFADCLIERSGAMRDCEYTATFDKGAADAGMRLVTRTLPQAQPVDATRQPTRDQASESTSNTTPSNILTAVFATCSVSKYA